MRRAILLAALAVALAGCAERGSIGGLVVLDERHVIEAGTSLAGDLVVIDGRVELRHGGRITGSAFVLGGEAEIAGTIDGDVAIVGGRVTITDEAVVVGGLRRGGGEVDQAGGASIGEELVSPVAVDALIGLTEPVSEAEGFDPWLVVRLAVLALLAALGARLAPVSIERMLRAMESTPLVPMAVGVLALVVGLSLVVFMAFTVVLVPVALLLVLGSAMGAGLGTAALGVLVLRRTLGRSSAGGHRSLQAALGSVAVAAVVVGLSGIPLVGELAVVGLGSLTLGAWLATRFGTRELRLEER